MSHACVVDQEIESAKPTFHRRKQLVNLNRIAHVADHRQHADFVPRQLPCRLVQVRTGPTANDEIASFAGQRVSDGQTNALASASDQRNFPSEVRLAFRQRITKIA